MVMISPVMTTPKPRRLSASAFRAPRSSPLQRRNEAMDDQLHDEDDERDGNAEQCEHLRQVSKINPARSEVVDDIHGVVIDVDANEEHSDDQPEHDRIQEGQEKEPPYPLSSRGLSHRRNIKPAPRA